jgi:hypothetical protein
MTKHRLNSTELREIVKICDLDSLIEHGQQYEENKKLKQIGHFNENTSQKRLFI